MGMASTTSGPEFKEYEETDGRSRSEPPPQMHPYLGIREDTAQPQVTEEKEQNQLWLEQETGLQGWNGHGLYVAAQYTVYRHVHNDAARDLTHIVARYLTVGFQLACSGFQILDRNPWRDPIIESCPAPPADVSYGVLLNGFRMLREAEDNPTYAGSLEVIYPEGMNVEEEPIVLKYYCPHHKTHHARPWTGPNANRWNGDPLWWRAPLPTPPSSGEDEDLSSESGMFIIDCMYSLYTIPLNPFWCTTHVACTPFNTHIQKHQKRKGHFQ